MLRTLKRLGKAGRVKPPPLTLRKEKQVMENKVSNERFEKLTNKIDKIKDYNKRDYFRLLAEASFLYDSLGDFEECSEQVAKQLEQERKAK